MVVSSDPTVVVEVVLTVPSSDLLVVEVALLEGEGEEGVVVFGVREYTEDTRRRSMIPEAAWIMEIIQREARQLAAAADDDDGDDDGGVAAADVAAA